MKLLNILLFVPFITLADTSYNLNTNKDANFETKVGEHVTFTIDTYARPDEFYEVVDFESLESLKFVGKYKGYTAIDKWLGIKNYYVFKAIKTGTATLNFANEHDSFKCKIKVTGNILDFCNENPEHKNVKAIKSVFEQAKPRLFLINLWRLVTGKKFFMPNDFKRVYLMNAAKEIGKELGWDKKKIDEEVDTLFAELKRIQNQ